MRLFGLMSRFSNIAPATVGDRGPVAQRSAGGNERGFALLAALMLVLLALTLGAGTLLFTLFDLKATQSFGTGNQAFAAAEAGLHDAINTINTRGVVNFKKDVIESGIISKALTSISGFSGVSYQVTDLVSGTNPDDDGIITVTGKALLSAQRIIKVNVTRGGLLYGAGALHLSNDNAVGTFGGNSMTIDGNNWLVTDITTNPPIAALDPSWPARPAISTRSDTVTTQVINSLGGQGTVTGLGPSPSVMTTNAGSTADLNQFVTDILTANGAPNGCNQNGTDYWLPGKCNSGPPGTECGVHCIHQTNGNAQNGKIDKWGTLAVPNVTYVYDNTAKLAGGDYGAGILIFSGSSVSFNGSFGFCGWVLFQNPNASITIQGTPNIYGEVLSPLPTATAGGSLTVRYSQNCLAKADGAGVIGPKGNLPHPVVITSWVES